jgi:regulator of sirC expression with transglutaminase-like and TPR domain
MNTREIQAMIQLLEDPSEDVFKVVSENLLGLGPDIIQELENAWENGADQLFQERLENLIQTIQYNASEKEIIHWIRSDHSDILRGAYLIAKLQFPDLKYSNINDPIEKIKNDVWIELNDNLTALEKIKILNQLLYKVHGFGKNMTHPDSPQNSYINQVIEIKKGNTVSLSIIYLSICQKLGLPVSGVDLPGTIILAFADETGLTMNTESAGTNILFYINPFNRGAVLGRTEIDYYLKQSLIKPVNSFYEPCSNTVIIRRLVNTLITSYENLGYKEKVAQLEKIIRLFPSE